HKRGVSIHESMEVCHGAAVMEMVKVGLGVGLQPRWVVRDDIQTGALKALPLGRGGVKRQWIIAHVKAAPLAEHARAFMQLCHKWFPHFMTDSEAEPASETALAMHG